jgi:hypothetical protein
MRPGGEANCSKVAELLERQMVEKICQKNIKFTDYTITNINRALNHKNLNNLIELYFLALQCILSRIG